MSGVALFSAIGRGTVHVPFPRRSMGTRKAFYCVIARRASADAISLSMAIAVDFTRLLRVARSHNLGEMVVVFLCNCVERWRRGAVSAP